MDFVKLGGIRCGRKSLSGVVGCFPKPWRLALPLTKPSSSQRKRKHFSLSLMTPRGELPALPATAPQPITTEVANAKITPIADPEAQSTVVVAATEAETQWRPFPSWFRRRRNIAISAPGGFAVSALSVFAVPEDVTRYLCRQGIPVEATATGQYKVEGRLEPLSLLQTRAKCPARPAEPSTL